MAQVATTLNIPDEQCPLDQIPISPVGGEHDSTEREEPQSTQEQLTVFHSPENFTVKHPLMNKWTLWFTKPAPAGRVSGTLFVLLAFYIGHLGSLYEVWLHKSLYHVAVYDRGLGYIQYVGSNGFTPATKIHCYFEY